MGETFKIEEIVGTSSESYADATRSAVEKAAAVYGGASWFEVVEMRGAIREGAVVEFQVKVKMGCKM